MKTLTKELLTTPFKLDKASQFEIDMVVKIAAPLVRDGFEKQVNVRSIEENVNKKIKPHVDEAFALVKDINVLIKKLQKLEDKIYSIRDKTNKDLSYVFDLYETDFYINDCDTLLIDYTPMHILGVVSDNTYAEAVKTVLAKRNILNQPFTLQIVVDDAIKYIREKHNV